MATPEQFVQHVFGGGFATDYGPTTSVQPQGGGGNDLFLVLPWLNVADNVLYELDGGPHKAPGTEKIEASAYESGVAITGVFDYWITGTSGTAVQHRIIHVGTKIKKDDADNTFTDLFTGLESGKIPNYSTFDDILIIASNSTTDVPKSWDGSTAQSLAGTPPNFAFSVNHHNRQWASGVASAPSRLYYSVSVDPEDWVGSGSGSIDIDPSDGDRITAIISHKNELWVFKGPYKGSIHRITGTAPTGDNPFARKFFMAGVGAVSQESVFRYRDDIGWMWSDGSIRSLSATNEFGDMREASLSAPIDSYLRDHIVFNQITNTRAASDGKRVWIPVTVDGGSTNNQVLVMDYRFNPVRWSLVPGYGQAFGPTSIARVRDPTNALTPRIFLGGDDGFLRRGEVTTRSIDTTTAITFKIETPYLDYRTPKTLKTISDASIGIQPKNSGNVTFGWTRDDQVEQTVTIAQGGVDPLDTFTLGTSTLGGSRYVDRFDATLTGTFRAISFRVTNAVNNEDLELHKIGATISGGDFSTENV